MSRAAPKRPPDEEAPKSDKPENSNDAPEEAPPAAAPKPEPPKETKFSFTPYGLLQAQTTYDSTESFQHGQGNNAIVRANSFAGQHGRLTMTSRNTIIGVRVKAPEWAGITSSARIEGDFEGSPPSNPPASNEGSFLTGGPFRTRQAYVLVETAYVNILAGQTQQLFGWGPIFYPNSTNNLGIPAHAFGREAQVKLSHTFKTSAIDVELAAGAFRPPARDGEIPDFQGGLRIAINPWKGIQNGNKLVPMQIAASGTSRSFRVQGLNTATTTAVDPRQDHSYTENGAGVAVDALIPLIPKESAENPGNALTVVGEFATGYGISDLYQSLNFGLPTQTLALPITAPSYTSPTNMDIDNGIVVFADPTSAVGRNEVGAGGIKLHAVDVQSFLINVQYVLPGLDMVELSAIYGYLSSDNVDKLVAAKETKPGSFSKIFIKEQYIDGSVHIDITPATRFSFSYCNTLQTFLDGGHETNHRGIFKANFAF